MATLNRTFSVKNGIDVANTIIVDSNRNLTNIATANANTVNATTFITVDGLNVTDQANSARLQANTARDTANDAYGQANSAYGQANTARTQANTAYGQANDAYGQANTARNTANDAYAAANAKVSINGDTMTGNLNVAAWLITQNIVPDANVTYSLGTASKRFKDLYLGGTTIYLGDTSISSDADELRSNTFNAATAFISGGLNVLDQANAARTQANTARDTANGAYGQANGAYAQANGAYAQANGAYSQANGGFAQANGAYAQANGAYTQANVSANTVRVYANSAGELSNKFLNFNNTASIQVTISDNGDGNANIAFNTTGAAVADAYAQANTARDTANDAYGQANTARATSNDAYAQANTARGTANDAYGQANAAYAEANLKLNLTGGTITGDLDITGNLYVGGNTTYINVSTYTVEDPLIYLAANNELDDMVDIGFIGGKNAAGVYAHTGLVRHAADDKWYLFDGLTEEGHQNNVIDVANTYLATLRANIEANSILLVGNSVATQANLTIANDQANAARDQANTAYGQANDAYAQANTARTTANDAYGQANTARDTANDSYAQANTARTQANTARTQANNAYGQANDAYAQANTAYGQANDAYAQANAAFSDSNTRVLKSGDTMTGTLTITTSGTGLSVGNVVVSSELAVGSLNVTTNTVTTSMVGQVVLDTFGTTEHASAKYFVQVKSGSVYHTTEVVLVQDATNVWLTEYGSIQTGASLGTFSADISSGDVRLLFNADNAVNTIRAVRYGVAPP